MKWNNKIIFAGLSPDISKAAVVEFLGYNAEFGLALFRDWGVGNAVNGAMMTFRIPFFTSQLTYAAADTENYLTPVRPHPHCLKSNLQGSSARQRVISNNYAQLLLPCASVHLGGVAGGKSLIGLSFSFLVSRRANPYPIPRWEHCPHSSALAILSR